MNRTKTLLLPLFKDLRIPTNGDSTPSYVYYDLDVPDFTHVLPFATSLVLYGLTVGAPQSNEYEWNVVFRSGFNRNWETADINAISTSNITGEGSSKSAVFTTTSKFYLESRLQIRVNNKTGTSGVRIASISGVLAVETVGM